MIYNNVFAKVLVLLSNTPVIVLNTVMTMSQSEKDIKGPNIN